MEPMRAIICTEYGPPEVLQLKEVATPAPGHDEILIKIHASTVTSGDVRLRSFTWARWFYLPARFMYGFRRPRRTIPGNELAGEVEATGRDITRFKRGDQVFGIIWSTSFGGANAEYICLPEDEVTPKPVNMTYEEAASVPIGGLTALALLRKAGIQRGQQVLVYGASGSVGTFAVQIAKYFGAEVTGVCSTANVEMVRSLGADRIIDYTVEDFTKSGQTHDVVFDAVMKMPFSCCKGSLRPGGAYLTVGYPLLEALWTSITDRRRVIFGTPRRIDELAFLKDLIEAGEIKAIVDRCYRLPETAEAHRYVEEGHKRGNVIITMG